MFVTGEIVNPLADARIESHQSLQSLAKKLEISKQYISRAENGTYHNVNEKLIKFAANQLKIHPTEIIKRYKEFQTETRRATADEFSPSMLIRGDMRIPGFEVFKTWRSAYWRSITEFSNGFCIHPEIVRGYEEGERDAIPNMIRTVLTRAGIMDPNWIEKSETKVNIQNNREIFESTPDHQRAHTVASEDARSHPY